MRLSRRRKSSEPNVRLPPVGSGSHVLRV